MSGGTGERFDGVTAGTAAGAGHRPDETMRAPTGDARRRPPVPDGGDAMDFETAQRDLFEAVGLDVRSRFVELESASGRTHVFETGPPDDDHPLAFVHGTAAFGAFLAPLVAQFDDVRTITFDRPGYGRSEPFEYTEENLLRTLDGTIEGVLDDAGVEQVDLVGHSMGAHAIIRFALAHPERCARLLRESRAAELADAG